MFGKKRIRPNIVIINPLAIDKDPEFLEKKDPILVAIAAREMKTNVNPKVNCIEPIKRAQTLFSVSENIAR